MSVRRKARRGLWPLGLALSLAAGCILPGEPVFDPFDDEGPVLVESVPFDGSLRVPTDAVIWLAFSEPLAEGQPGLDQLELRSGELVRVVRLEQPRQGLVRVQPEQPLPAGSRFTLELAESLRDRAFNPLEGERALGFTVSAQEDPLVVLSTVPAQGEVGLSLRPTLELDFDVPIAAVLLDRGPFDLRDPEGAPVGVRVVRSENDARRVEVSPFADLTPSTEYLLTVSTELRDVQSRHLALPFTLSFTTGP